MPDTTTVLAALAGGVLTILIWAGLYTLAAALWDAGRNAAATRRMWADHEEGDDDAGH